MRCATLFLILLAITPSSFADAPAPTAAAQELIQLERDYCAAQIARDAAFLARTLDDSYSQIGSRGTVQTRAQVLAAVDDQTSAVTACDQSDVQVRLYDGAAVVTGRTRAAGIYRGVAFRDRVVLWTDTFIRRDGRWRLVATQSTAAAQ